MDIKSIIYVGIGGGLGSIVRYLIYVYMPFQIGKSFPWPTLVVNITGAFLIGIIYTLFQKNQLTSPLYIMIVTGFLGGFTTLSAFSLESIQLLRNQEFLYASLYIVSTVIVAMLAVWIGMKIIR